MTTEKVALATTAAAGMGARERHQTFITWEPT